MKNFLHHLFIPHHKNNHRAKILHNSSLFILLLVLLFSSFTTSFIKKSNSDVLGISYSISENELLAITNKDRIDVGLAPLVLNRQLSNAAQMKAKDMFAKNYWAHFAPDGSTSPWGFIKDSGYQYLYAGENLAKGFTSSDDIVKAWMNSPSHRENMLSDKYKNVGFAVAEGKLLGEDTVLVVELFGSPQVVGQEDVSNAEKATGGEVAKVNIVNENVVNKPVVASENVVYSKPAIDTSLTKSLLIIFFTVILFAFAIDLIIVEKRKIPRMVGHNLDHIILILLFILFMIIERSGVIF